MKLSALARHIGARLIGDGDLDVVAVKHMSEATAGSLSIVLHAHDRAALSSTAATAVIVDEDFAADHAHELDVALLCGEEPSRLLGEAIDVLHPHEAQVSVGQGAVIEEGAVVGEGTIIGPNAVIRSCARIGARCVIGPGSVIGDEGFVFAPAGAQNLFIRSVAGVVIEDDVDVGANVCIDRGLLRDTRIGARTRIDNLANIGHDVVVGQDCVIIAHVALGGYVTLGDGVVLAGQSAVNPHVIIADGVRVGGQSGVTNDVKTAGAAVTGTPAVPHHEWLKAMVRLQQLDALEKRVRQLEKKK